MKLFGYLLKQTKSQKLLDLKILSNETIESASFGNDTSIKLILKARISYFHCLLI